MLHTEILSEQQKTLLPLVKEFRNSFGLVGGTALALHIGHRESIDFDLYFVIGQHCSLGDIVRKAESIFGSEFSEKNFRSQLAYFQDIDYSEAVSFRPGFEKDDTMIQETLVRSSVGCEEKSVLTWKPRMNANERESLADVD